MAVAEHPPVTTRSRRFLAFLLVPLVVATVAGAVVLWPSGDGPRLRPEGKRLDATITALRPVTCTGTGAGTRCIRPEARLAGTDGTVALAERPAGADADLAVGDRVVVTRAGDAYALAGHERRTPLLLLTAAALVLVVLVARRRGLATIVALAVSGVVLTVFAVPAVLDGADPLAAAVVAAALVAVAVVVIGTGLRARTATALVGTLLGIGIAGLVGQAVVESARLAGLDATPGYLHLGSGSVPMSGLLVAGVVLGTVGALVDLTARQVDATWDLRDTDPHAGWRGVAAAGLRRGRGNLADVTATVVLAYAGAALPALVLVAAGDQGVFASLGGEVLAVEVARALAGAVALAVAVPLTAALAAVVAVREAGARRPGDPRRFRTRHERDIWGS